MFSYEIWEVSDDGTKERRVKYNTCNGTDIRVFKWHNSKWTPRNPYPNEIPISNEQAFLELL